jgi:sugar/nucleoside kinase (ribokinase family)
VVREGAAGCITTGGPQGDRVVSVAAPSVRAIGTTGAGDSDTGVLVASLAACRGVDDALGLVTRAAALTVPRLDPRHHAYRDGTAPVVTSRTAVANSVTPPAIRDSDIWE